jgi:hypothetical protein
MARRKNVKRIDPRYFLNETVIREMNADIAQRIDRIVLSVTEALRGIVESGVLSANKDPETRASLKLRPGVEAPPNASGSRLESMITQYVDKLDEAAALQLGRGGSSDRWKAALKTADFCKEELRNIPPCPEGEESCTLIRNAVGYLACLDDGADAARWLKENGLGDINQQIYVALNDEMRNRFQ